MKKKQIIRIAQLTLLAAAALTLTASADAKNRPKKIIVVRTMDLPELARVPGEAMILQATGDGKTHLCVEQNNGARLDVTDPANVKQESATQLDARPPIHLRNWPAFGCKPKVSATLARLLRHKSQLAPPIRTTVRPQSPTGLLRFYDRAD